VNISPGQVSSQLRIRNSQEWSPDYFLVAISRDRKYQSGFHINNLMQTTASGKGSNPEKQQNSVGSTPNKSHPDKSAERRTISRMAKMSFDFDMDPSWSLVDSVITILSF